MERAGTVKERGRGTQKGKAGLRAVESLPESRSHDAGSPGCTPEPWTWGTQGTSGGAAGTRALRA